MESRQVQLVRDQLDRLIVHPSFLNKKRIAAFLRFVVGHTLSGDLARLKESVIGVEVYGRDPSYDPKANPIVRTEARRLRGALEEYFTGAGAADPVIIRIPKGSYVAQFEFPTPAGELSAIAVAPDASQSPILPARWPMARTLAKFSIGFLGFCLLATAAFTFINARRPAVSWSAQPFSRLGGVETFSAFSPDGQKLAFVWSGPQNDNADIYIQDLTADAPTRLTTNAAEDNRPAWSPDGKQIAFIRLAGNGRKELDLITLATRRETTVMELEGSYPWLCIIPRISWSPDGRTLFTSESFGMGQACGVVSIDLQTHELRRVTQPPAGIVGDLEPQVSPDGSQLAFLRNDGEMGGDIYVTSITGGPVRRMTFDNRDIMGFCWRPNGQSFVAASRRGDGVVKLWQIAAGSGETKQLTDGSSVLAFPSIAPQGDRIAYTSYRNITNIWRLNDAGNSLLIPNESGNSNPQLSPDGRRLLFRSDRTGAFEFWTSDPNGQNSRRLTHFNGPMVNSPAWSPDGKQIAFECRSLAHSDICLTGADGAGNARRFTQWSSNEILPSWSRDGRSLYFASNYSGRWEIYKQALGGGEPVPITHGGGMRAVESWDGRFVYVHRGQPLGGMVRLPVETADDAGRQAAEARVFLSELGGGQWGDWDVSPDGLVYLPVDRITGLRSVRAFNPITGESRLLHRLAVNSPDGDCIFSIAPDGRSFFYVAAKSYDGAIGMLVRTPPAGPSS